MLSSSLGAWAASASRMALAFGVQSNLTAAHLEWRLQDTVRTEAARVGVLGLACLA